MTLIYGVKVTLNCMKCGMELTLEDPFRLPPGNAAERVLDGIRIAHVDHVSRDECHPKEPE